MAAFAALASLLNIVDQIHNHPRVSKCFDQKQIESLSQKVDSLLALVEKYAADADLESQIASAAQAAEDIIEFHIVDQIQILAGSAENTSPSLLDLQTVTEEMDSVEKKTMEVKGVQLTDSTAPAAPSTSIKAAKTTMVGFDQYRDQLMDTLTRDQSQRLIIPITGMGGIGKTTLAKHIYESSYIKSLFPVRAWVAVSQKCSAEKVLFEILSCLRESTREMTEKTDADLHQKLHKILFVERYLIIIDDIWSIDAWEKIQFFFPQNDTGSRIILTTRQKEVVKYFSSSAQTALALDTLKDDKSWELFCNEAFHQEGGSCPKELEKIAAEIVGKCKGLPLSLAVIGGLLGKSSRNPEYWEIVAKDISSALDSAGDSQYENLLPLSYNYLPACLKPCFLYLGVFPEDHEFRVSRLVKLWIAEGLLKPIKRQNLEDVAEGLLEPSKTLELEDIARGFITDLVDRNLIIGFSWGSSGKLRTCKIHDLLRDICLRVVEKEKFLSVEGVLNAPRDVNMERRIINHGRTQLGAFRSLGSASLARSLICGTPSRLSFKSKLLRLLIEVYSDSLDATLQQVNLRLLSYESLRAPVDWIETYELPPTLSLLWNVQTLIIDRNVDKVVAPSEIWEMQKLRHLVFKRVCLPDPPPSEKEDGTVLQNLQTVKTVEDFKCSNEVRKRMPNIRKLKLFYEDFSEEGGEITDYCLNNISHFKKLESLSCCFCTTPDRDHLLQNLKLPSSLKKLVLQYCELHWDDLTIIGSSLPLLEVLKLKYQSVRGPEWNPVEGEFVNLKFLEIDSCYLICWNDAGNSHFKRLEKLVLVGLYKLDEIPFDMAGITTLQSISVVECSVSAAISAIKILDEKVANGDEDLPQVRIGFRQKAEVEEFKGKVKQKEWESLTYQIYQV